MRVLVAGAAGMVGRATVAHCANLGDQVFAYDRAQLDITDEAAVTAAFAENRPEAAINCAAWTDVDACESDRERAFAANARGPEILAAACRRFGASFVTISTDYVFDGAKPDWFYTQRDDPQPLSVYGQSKLDGERRSAATCARTSVVRTGWIFGPHGRNFLSLIVDLAKRGQALKAINDSYGTPTYAPHLATRLRELAALDLPGVYHVVGGGNGASFAEFGRYALDAAGLTDVALESVSMDSLSRPAPRPRNSRLRCLVSEAVGLAPLPDWQSSVREFVARSEDDHASARS